LPKADLGEATISADGTPAEIARGARLTTTAGGEIAVQGLLRLDAEADFTPSNTVIKIVGTRPDGTKVTMDSRIAKTEKVADNLYRAGTVIRAPAKSGTYRIIGKFRGNTFSEGDLDVSL
jgi:hypothetical protein